MGFNKNFNKIRYDRTCCATAVVQSRKECKYEECTGIILKVSKVIIAQLFFFLQRLTELVKAIH